MSGSREKINAAVDSAVRYSPLAGNMQLLSQVFLILLVYILDYGLPAGGWSSRKWWTSDHSRYHQHFRWYILHSFALCNRNTFFLTTM